MTEKLILSLRLISPQLFYEQLRPRYLVHDPPHPAPIPVIISIFHRWIHNSTLYPSGWDGNWMELELKYNRYQRIYKKEGNNRRKIYIYICSWTMEKKNWSILWKMERKSVDFPPFHALETKEKGIASREGMIEGKSWSMKILLD